MKPKPSPKQARFCTCKTVKADTGKAVKARFRPWLPGKRFRAVAFFAYDVPCVELFPQKLFALKLFSLKLFSLKLFSLKFFSLVRRTQEEPVRRALRSDRKSSDVGTPTPAAAAASPVAAERPPQVLPGVVPLMV